MKTLTSLIVFLCLVAFTSVNRADLPVDNSQSLLESFKEFNTKPLISDTLGTVEVNISKLKEYLNTNKNDFTDVLINYGKNKKDKLYFMLLAANKPAIGSALTSDNRASKEFSTEPGVGFDFTILDNINNGKNKDNRKKFKEDFSDLNFIGYYMSMSALVAEIEKINPDKVNADIVKTTNDQTSVTYMDVVFKPNINTTGTSRTLSSMDSATLSSGCPPFNCDY